jgi:hypothetical protein
MDLRPYICKQCGGQIDPATMRCEYCNTYHDDPALRRLTISTRVPGEYTIRAEVALDRYGIEYNPEGARDHALRELRNQIADGLLAYMKITTSTSFDPKWMANTEIIRGEVRVVDPSFTPSFGRY